MDSITIPNLDDEAMEDSPDYLEKIRRSSVATARSPSHSTPPSHLDGGSIIESIDFTGALNDSLPSPGIDQNLFNPDYFRSYNSSSSQANSPTNFSSVGFDSIHSGGIGSFFYVASPTSSGIVSAPSSPSFPSQSANANSVSISSISSRNNLNQDKLSTRFNNKKSKGEDTNTVGVVDSSEVRVESMSDDQDVKSESPPSRSTSPSVPHHWRRNSESALDQVLASQETPSTSPEPSSSTSCARDEWNNMH